MAIRSIQIFAPAEQAGASDNISYYEFPRNATVVGIQYNLHADLDADLEQATFELSRQATWQGEVNNPLGPIASFTIGAAFTTSGMTKNTENGFYPCGEKFLAGERIYANAFTVGTGAAELRAILSLEE